MTNLPENPTLPQLQAYMKAVCEERGWDQTDYATLFLLFTEEVGELAKALRKHHHLWDEPGKAAKKPFALHEEFADVLGYLLDLANHMGVDLEEAFRKKEAVNTQRHWK